MWFKQIQLFQLASPIRLSPESLVEKLEPLLFKPCLPSLPQSSGWVSPIDEPGAPLIRSVNGCIMLCVQIEEKILPATVIRQEVMEKVKKIETLEGRKVYQKEKLTLKDEMTVTLLPRAFSKLNRYYAYLDTRSQQLVMGTTNAKVIEQFISLFKKSFNVELHVVELKKLSSFMTSWLKDQSYPGAFSIEKACVLQDPSQQNRVVRCQQQDLFVTAIQSFIKDGFEVIQLALSWHDRVKFVLTNNFSLRSIQFQEEIIAQVKEIAPETKQQQLDADFLIMTETLSQLFSELQQAFLHERDEVEQSKVA